MNVRRGLVRAAAALAWTAACAGPPGTTARPDAGAAPDGPLPPDAAPPADAADADADTPAAPDAPPGPGPIALVDVTAGTGLPAAGTNCLVFDDLDGDARPDLLVGVPHVGVSLFRNQGDGTFVEAPLGVPATGRSCAAADVDGDGVMDVAVAHDAGSVTLLRGLGGGAFEDISARLPDLTPSVAVYLSAITFLDYDGDGRQDLVAAYLFYGDFPSGASVDCAERADGDVTCLIDPPLDQVPPRLLRNEGDVFVEVPGAFGPADARAVWSLGVVDWDRDGHLDVLATVDFGPNALWRNVDGTGVFEDVLPALGAGGYNHGMGAAIADLDGDQALDVYVADLGPDQLWLRVAGGGLVDHAWTLGVAEATRLTSSWSPVAADLDQDGRLDLFVPVTLTAATMDEFLWVVPRGFAITDQLQRDLLFTATDAGYAPTFLDHPDSFAAVEGSAAAAADVDGDGDLDLAETYAWPRRFRLLRNDTAPAGRWLQVRLLPPGATATDGAEVAVEACGVRRLRIATAEAGGTAKGWRTVHVGLGACDVADAVEVRWPSGATTRLEGPHAVDRVLELAAP